MENITVIVPFRHGTEPDRRRFPAGTVFSDDEGQGKKYALRKAVSAAATEYVWLTDDDTVLPAIVFAASESSGKPEKPDSPEDPFRPHNADLLILPLNMQPGNGSLLERLQQTEYAAIQSLTMLAAEHGRPVMCSGANLIVRRERWLESYADLRPGLPGGDDMFLLESFKRRGLRIAVPDADDCRWPAEAGAYTASVMPQPDLRGLLRQRMRWAGKAPHYTDRDIRLCGAAVVLLNLLAVVCPPCFVLKYLLDVWIIRRGRRYGIRCPHRMRRALLLSLIYPWYMLICLIGGIFLSFRKREVSF